MRTVPYNQPTSAPTPKMAAVGISGAITVVLVYLVEALLDIEMPAEVASALTIIVGFVAGYMTKDQKPPVAAQIIRNSGV